MLVLPLVCHEYAPMYNAKNGGMYSYDPYEMYSPPAMAYETHMYTPQDVYYAAEPFPPASSQRHNPRRKAAKQHGGRGSHAHSNAHKPEQTQPVAESTSDQPQFTICQHKINQRMKQIQYGKNTIGYHMYIQAIPVEQREEGNERHPVTPRVDQQCSKRNWDAQVQKWRRDLHLWDPPACASEEGSERGTHHSTSGSEGEENCGKITATRGSPLRDIGERELRERASPRQGNFSNLDSEQQHHSWASDASEEPNWEDVQDFMM
eukprot:TRINITY_DN660_c0_g1_i1.p1 TRINITY_DN660_c0_g1~~TRINITY_DN660_c0_g1_i1.p1  ORF type:complete len:263 (+),score=37.01 TRINITY_DN660_c0_g1_i1:64-852(+)